jgi:hypothetical protein
VKQCTLPSSTKVGGREFHKILVSVTFLSSAQLNTAAGSMGSSRYLTDIGIPHLLERLTDFRSIPISFLLDKHELSSELSFPTEITGETCQCIKYEKA